ncbi:universal stress protein [Kovacikia minuta CCNUW1]|uniref:universal stress protein n=1 Tax=Kovacikia minuta TaxID=2931930 RepID=UPI001CCC72F9|nr:universal stress protein [Kovacikia minuta]UBF27304.1 universal stress protein [Kovacikia minuta CCNUW1]
MFQRLLFCTDLSDGVYRLVNFIPSLAATGAKQIVFLHSVPFLEGSIPREDTEKINQAREQLEPALKHSSATVEVKVEVVSGRAMDTILRAAKTHQTDLVVLGMPIHGQLKERLFGSTTVGLCQKTPIPLMVLRPQLISTYTSEELELRCQHLFRWLLIPYDGSDSARYLVEQVKRYAANRPEHSLERCNLCWVVEDVNRRGLPADYQVEPAQKALVPVKAELESLGLQVKTEVRQGDSIVEVLNAALMDDVSAIAIASKSLGKLQELSVASFTRELLNRCWHPIIYFPMSR